MIANAREHREEKLKAIVLSAAPCGHCRQILNELAEASDLKILISTSSDYSLSSLLPQSFGPPHPRRNKRTHARTQRRSFF